MGRQHKEQWRRTALSETTAGCSVTVDPTAVPYCTPLWLDTTEPLSATPLRHVVLAQDTGRAIAGEVRVDYFWGSGEARASRRADEAAAAAVGAVGHVETALP